MNLAVLGTGFAPELDRKIKETASERGVSQADLIREAVSWFLSRHIEALPPRKRGKVKRVHRTVHLPAEHAESIRALAERNNVSNSYVIEYAVRQYFNENLPYCEK